VQDRERTEAIYSNVWLKTANFRLQLKLNLHRWRYMASTFRTWDIAGCDTEYSILVEIVGHSASFRYRSSNPIHHPFFLVKLRLPESPRNYISPLDTSFSLKIRIHDSRFNDIGPITLSLERVWYIRFLSFHQFLHLNSAYSVW
jgi:hypothetical protein